MGDGELLRDADRQGVRIYYRKLRNGLAGLYDPVGHLIVLDETLSDHQRRCTLAHELVHARYNDRGCGTTYGAKAERRARRLTALRLIDPIEYASAELAYDADPFLIAQTLGVTVQVVNDYRALLHDSGRIPQEGTL